jgi:hypothetical protein
LMYLALHDVLSTGVILSDHIHLITLEVDAC